MEGQAYCSGHQQWMPESEFYGASLWAGESRCKKCNSNARRERRRRDPLRRLQWKIYQMEHRHGGSYPSTALVQSIMERHRELMDTQNVQDLCAVRYFTNLSLERCPWNAVLLPTAQKRQTIITSFHCFMRSLKLSNSKL